MGKVKDESTQDQKDAATEADETTSQDNDAPEGDAE